MKNRQKTGTINLRVSEETRQLIERAQTITPYTMTITSLVERGIALAVAELTRMNEAAGDER